MANEQVTELLEALDRIAELEAENEKLELRLANTRITDNGIRQFAKHFLAWHEAGCDPDYRDTWLKGTAWKVLNWLSDRETTTPWLSNMMNTWADWKKRAETAEAANARLRRAWRVLHLGWGEVPDGKLEDVAEAREVREEVCSIEDEHGDPEKPQ